MKLAIFSDVHGNLIALEKFIKTSKHEVDGYICLGDVVGYGPWNDECLEQVRQLPLISMIMGNHENLFLGKESINCEIPLVQDFFVNSIKFFSCYNLIKSLPIYCTIGSYRCVHTINNISVYPDTEISISHNYIIGHVHHQYSIERSNFRIINPGSVGQNRKWINIINYAIIDPDLEQIVFKSIPYDVDKFITELIARKYPENCIAYYKNKPRADE